MAKIKKATKAKKRAAKRIAENVGPERRRVRAAAAPDAERFILEEAREVREKRHSRVPKGTIIAIGLARARNEPSAELPPKSPRAKSRVKEGSANAYRKSAGPLMGRKKSTARKSGMGSGHRRRSRP